MNTKPWYKSKVIWYAIVSAVAGILAAVATEFPDLAFLSTINAIIMVVLRLLTTESVS